MKKNNKGFTLTELIVVIVIIAILAAVLIPTLTGTVNKSRKSAASQEATSMNTTYQAWLIDTASYCYDAEIMEDKTTDDATTKTTKATLRLTTFANYYLRAQNDAAEKTYAAGDMTGTQNGIAIDGITIITVGDASTNSFVMQASNKYFVKYAKTNGAIVYTVDADYTKVIA